MRAALGSRVGVEGFHCCGEHLLALGTKCLVSSILHHQVEIGMNAPPEQKLETGESYQRPRSPRSPVPRVGRSPHPVHLAEEKGEVLEIAKEMGAEVGMRAGSDQDSEVPQHSPVWSTEGNRESVAMEKGTGTDEEPQRNASR